MWPSSKEEAVHIDFFVCSELCSFVKDLLIIDPYLKKKKTVEMGKMERRRSSRSSFCNAVLLDD